MLEILAPAGNQQCALAAIDSGANAIYLGYSAFSARQGAQNFDLEGLKSVVCHAHFCGTKVYVAMNTIVKNDEIDSFLQTLVAVWNVGVDAIILQDALLGSAIHAQYPNVVLHLSTQAGVCTENGAIFAKECGFSRVILARETPLEEISKIAKIIETEVFVQGALCTCFSGQCYFSSFAGGNSGNRGRCKQPCRKLYSYDRKGFEERAYALSLSDLCVGTDIQKYIDAGVVSFKIEGRMRRAEYVAAAVQYYRAILDHASEKTLAECISALKRTYNRGNYTKGLAFGQDKRFLSTAIQGHLGEKVGVVKVLNGKYFVESIFTPQAGDAFKILRDGKEVGGAIFQKSEGRGFVLSSKIRLKNGDSVFVTTDSKTNEKLLSVRKQGEISLRLQFHENDFARVWVNGAEWTSEERLQTANTRPLTAEDLRVCFSKTDGLPIDVCFEEIDVTGNIFIPKSVLNGYRRAVYERLVERVANIREEVYTSITTQHYNGNNDKIAVIATDFDGVKADIAIYKATDLTSEYPCSFTKGNFEKFVYYPAFCTAQDEDEFVVRMCKNGIDGVYVENYGGLVFAQKHNFKVFVGTGLNLINDVAIQQLLKLPNICYYVLSKEVNESETRGLITDKAFALTSGNIKIMDLCYCPFGKTCKDCDKKGVYTLTDEHGRQFPVRRYVDAKGVCRFEVYNCADLVSKGVYGAGKLLDATLVQNKACAILAITDETAQKSIYKNYTSGHYKRGVE